MKYLLIILFLLTFRTSIADTYGVISADNIQHSSVSVFSANSLNNYISYSVAGKLDKNNLTVLNAFIEAPHVRVGRVRYIYGMFNASRDYSPEYTPLTAPVSMYRPSMQRFMSSGDGIQFYEEQMIGFNFINASITIAKPIFDNKDVITHDILMSNKAGKIDSNKSHITSVDLYLSNLDKGIALNYSRNELAMGVTPNNSVFNPISFTNSLHVVLHNFGVRKYFNNGFDLTVEKMISTGHGNTWNAVNSFYNSGPYGHLIAVRYSGDIEYTAGVDYYNTGLNSVGANAFQLTSQDTYSRSKWISFRKDLNNDFILKYQFTKLDGTACASYKTRSEVQLSYKF
jgi:hypothetical protein